jgi:hypothetical protein
MLVYAVTHTCGISSGYKELIGICSSEDKAEKTKETDMKRNCRNEWHYSIKPAVVDKTVNETYMEW